MFVKVNSYSSLESDSPCGAAINLDQIQWVRFWDKAGEKVAMIQFHGDRIFLRGEKDVQELQVSLWAEN